MDVLTVSISSPEKLIFQGKADSVSSENKQGPFDILPQHANFITIVEKHPVILRSGGKKTKYDFDRVIIYTHNNYVSCYTI